MATCKHDLIFIQHMQGTTYKVNNKEYIGRLNEHIGYRVVCRQCQYNKTFKYVVDFPRWLKARLPFLRSQGFDIDYPVCECKLDISLV